jgi:hypothetical protein
MIDNSSRPERGFLMDLDLAIREERVAVSGASHRTGMPHTYRHDLESFFSFLYGSQHFTRPPPQEHVCVTRAPPTIFSINLARSRTSNASLLSRRDSLKPPPDSRNGGFSFWRDILFPPLFVRDNPPPNDKGSAQDQMSDAMIRALEGAIKVEEGGC